MSKSFSEWLYNGAEGSLELYDLGADPAEQLDISATAGPIVESMQGELFAWMAHTLQMAHDLPRAAPPVEFRDAVW